MSTKPDTFRTLIDQLGGIPALASALGIPENTAKLMRFRNSIAVSHWEKLTKAAHKAGIKITDADLRAMWVKAERPKAAKKREGEAA